MTPLQNLFEICGKYNLNFSTAESLTGGMMGSDITSLSGASKYFWGGFIVYTEDAKIKLLGVKPETLEKYGAVSEQCAVEMALGALYASGASCSVAVTGFAGPGGSTDASSVPVGSVWLAVALRPSSLTEALVQREYMCFTGCRNDIRKKTVDCAESLLVNFIRTYYGERLS